jgi:3-deoxy-manno-octulosonate cytidylyltransferase (CMP-KDO synthetase)
LFVHPLTASQKALSAAAIIPARFQSIRLPGKALADLDGLPMIVRVYERVRATPGLTSVIVATDDERIAAAVAGHGGEWRMTRADHPSGTDRLAEVASELPVDLIVNVQGDEPLIDPAAIAAALEPFTLDDSLEMSTLCRRITTQEEFDSPHITKVVVGLDGFALYFSRAPIPFHRSADPHAPPTEARKHIGVYVYRRRTLLRLAAWTPTANERTEALEQLRALEHGIRIRVVETPYDSIAVDTSDDLERVRRVMVGSARPLAGHHA